jgi:hypothetical protein
MDRLKPMGRTLEEFNPLGEGERRLLDACQKGEMARLGTATPESATDSQRIRAAFLRFLLLGGDERAPVHERGVQLGGAFVEGALDLRDCRIPASVFLSCCHFDSAVRAMDAHIGGLLSLRGCHLAKGLFADRLRCSADVQLRDGFKATGMVRLPGAIIGGALDCTGGQIEVKEGDALSADGADVNGNVSLRKGFKATGEVRLLGAIIGGDLDCTGGHFEVKEGDSFSADGVEVKRSVLMRDGFKASGEVRLMGAMIGGNLDCADGQFDVKEGDAFSCDGADVKGDLMLRQGFKASGVVRLMGVKIGGNLDCIGGQFEVKEGDALSADGVDVKGTVFLSGGFRATGEVRMVRANISGILDCIGGQFEVKEGDALSADGVDVKGTVFLSGGFRATGEVRLLGANIGGDLVCSDGQFEVKEGDALSADSVDVNGTVFLSNGFKATGRVRLPGANIGGDLDCAGGQFEVKEGDALSADRAEVEGSVYLRHRFKATGRVSLAGAQIGGNLLCIGAQMELMEGIAFSMERAALRGVWHLHSLPQPLRVNAAHATVAVLSDELAAWAPGSFLDGFRYDALGGQAPTSGKVRREWLCTQSEGHLGDSDGAEDFRPQPWRHAQRVLREMGHTEDAKQVGIAFEDRLRAIGRLGQTPHGTPVPVAWLKRFVAHGAHYIFGKLAGYGYRPIRLVGWMVSVWFLCGMAYWWLALPPRSALAPSDPLVFQNTRYEECLPDRPGKPGNWFLCSPLRGEYATFSPLAFSLDVMLPVVDLGQERTWGAFVPTPKESPLEEMFGHFHSGHVARLLIWFETLFGWLSSLLLVAIVSGFSRRNDEG